MNSEGGPNGSKNQRKLSPRLSAVYQQLLVGEEVWDVCCDHGYLGLAAFESGHFSDVHFVDQAVHLIERLRSKYQLQAQKKSRMHFWPCSGEDVATRVCGNVVIAGVGATTTLQILNGLFAKEKLFAKRLILSPHKDQQDLSTQKISVYAEWLLSKYQLHVQIDIPDGKRSRQMFVYDLI